MRAPEILGELRAAWFPNLTDSALSRLIELLEEASPYLVHGCFTRVAPMGCLATQAAWHHPRTCHLTVDAGITWLHHIAGLNPATSVVLQEWDRCGVHDLELREFLLHAFRQESARRLNRRKDRAPEMLEV
jgi:hypothetical protein